MFLDSSGLLLSLGFFLDTVKRKAFKAVTAAVVEVQTRIKERAQPLWPQPLM